MTMLNINGTSLFYEIHGSGTPLIFIHSHGLSHEMFFPQIQYFSKKYKVVLVDLRGNGKSGDLKISNDEIMIAQTNDIKMLLEYLDISKAVFIGVSDGGLLVQKFSYLYPEMVSAIILSDSYSNNKMNGLFGKLASVIQAASWVTYYLPSELFLRSLKITYYRWNIAYSALRNETLKKRPTNWIKQRIALSKVDHTSLLPHIKVPALCVVGDFSSDGIRRMQETAELIPNSRFKLIEDSFDPSNLCQPRQFNDTVMGFLEANKDPSING
ncbi:alpha/beta fold hydrolase [Cohnella sp. WQ 127256]|uniref:alpha/beta fold hydrolase n=1 Tax=Cohnella sp. WQ 127256 TaxID=2938790 RepID=UPI0021179FB0|nr:alpha/beta hydrolase [Cohnella sp. WQ 127256]